MTIDREGIGRRDPRRGRAVLEQHRGAPRRSADAGWQRRRRPVTHYRELTRDRRYRRLWLRPVLPDDADLLVSLDADPLVMALCRRR